MNLNTVWSKFNHQLWKILRFLQKPIKLKPQGLSAYTVVTHCCSPQKHFNWCFLGILFSNYPYVGVGEGGRGRLKKFPPPRECHYVMLPPPPKAAENQIWLANLQIPFEIWAAYGSQIFPPFSLRMEKIFFALSYPPLRYLIFSCPPPPWQRAVSPSPRTFDPTLKYETFIFPEKTNVQAKIH